MRLFYFLLLFLTPAYSASAQRLAIESQNSNFFYWGIGNPVNIVLEKFPCGRLEVRTDNGTIEGAMCQFIFRPEHKGTATIEIYSKGSNKLKKIGAWKIAVKKIPDPLFKIGPYGQNSSAAVSGRVLAAQEFVRGELEDFDIDARFIVDSFRVRILKSDSCSTRYFSVWSNQLSDELRSEFYQLKENDIVVFDRIYAKGPDGEERNLKALVLTMGR